MRRAWALGLIAVCGMALLIAPIFAFSQPFCDLHNADGIISAIMSVQKITWFYWGQTRLGSLLPLLASPLDGVADNMRAQVFLRTVLGLLSFAGLQLFLGPVRHVFVRVMLAMLVAGAVFNPRLVFFYLESAHPFGTATSVMAAALAVGAWGWHGSALRLRIALVLASFLALVAFWVNIGGLLLFGPLALGMLLVDRRYGIAFVLLMGAFAIAWLHAMSQGAQVHLGIALDPQSWVSAWQALPGWIDPNWLILGIALDPQSWVSAWQALPGWIHPSWLIAQVLLTAGGLATLHARAKSGGRRGFFVDDALFRLELLFAVSLAYQLFVPSLGWVRLNDFNPRYALPAYVALSMVTAGVMVELVQERSWPSWLRLAPVSALSVLLATWHLAGPMQRGCSFIQARHIPDVAFLRERAQAYDVDLAGGWYWLAWPTVFYTLDLRQELGDARPIYGVSSRGEAMSAEIAARVNASGSSRVVCADTTASACAWDAARMSGWEQVRWELLEAGDLPSGKPFQVLELKASR